jgi:spore germination protein GerM
MNPQTHKPPDTDRNSDRRAIWRVAGAASFFLIVGLGILYAYFALTQPPTAGLRTGTDPLPLLPADRTEPNRIKLFFTAAGVRLVPEMREIEPTDSLRDRSEAVLTDLLRGPRSRTLRSPIPRGVKVRGLYVTTGSLVLDLSGELRSGLTGGVSAELLCIYSIVNTLLLNCPDFETVTLLVDGRPVETLLGYLDLSEPLVENLALIASEPDHRGAVP